MNALNAVLRLLASLRLTVVLLSLSILLVFAGTSAMVDQGLWQVQKGYFHSAVAWVPPNYLNPFRTAGQEPMTFTIPFLRHGGTFPGIPIPGGYVLGLALLINLVAAHVQRFKFSLKDLALVPLLGAMAAAVAFWHYDPKAVYLIVAMILGVGLVLLLAMFHGKRTGIILTHLGLIVLLAGEGITSRMARESQMTIDEGGVAHFSQDTRSAELAVVLPGPDRPDAKNTEVTVSHRALTPGATIKDARLPFEIKVDAFYANSQPMRPGANPGKPTVVDPATAGDRAPVEWTVVEKPVANGSSSQTDVPSAFVTLSRDGRVIGSYLMSCFNEKPQRVEAGGKAYEVALRFTRYYHDYTIKLIDFAHDRYPGTDIPKNFASHIKLVDPVHNEQLESKIWMNHPLRYRGDTLFQASFKPGDKTTVLQIVRNPGALMPYVSIIIATIGLVLHFGITLAGFLLRRPVTNREMFFAILAIAAESLLTVPIYHFLGLTWAFVFVGAQLVAVLTAMFVYYLRAREAQPGFAVAQPARPRVVPPPVIAGARPATQRGGKGGKDSPAAVVAREAARREMAPTSRFSAARVLVPLGVLAVFAVYVAGHAVPRAPQSDYDLDTFAKLPISFDGRVQPVDTLARNALKVISGRDSAVLVVKENGKDVEKKVPAVQWFLDAVFATSDARVPDYRVFRIDHPEVKDLIGLDRNQKLFSLEQIVAKDRRKVQEALQKAFEVPKPQRSQYQNKLVDLGEKIMLYQRVEDVMGLHAVAPLEPGEKDWRMLRDAQEEARGSGRGHPSLVAFAAMRKAYVEKVPSGFNSEARGYAQALRKGVPQDAAKASFETWYNRFDPSFIAFVLYIAVFVFAIVSMIDGWEPVRRSALWLLGLTLAVHTVALAARIYITGRPPVTNLANSHIFIGFAAALFGLAAELLFRRGIGAACAGLFGAVTLLVYHELALDGDTMKVLVAVLDTNIWLATHVIIITLGYAATYLAALIGLAYLGFGMFSASFDQAARKTLARIIYGITCFAILFSFVGTILGGIWADQSWGRFWGWDPKENGAVLLVLANALYLHARWGGLVRERGQAVLAVVGAMVTTWSWWGTNLMGVGLHSYGFMESGVFNFLLIELALLVLVVVGAAVPVRVWRSYKADAFAPGVKEAELVG